MLINFSNHPLETWSQNQLDDARAKFGGIVDIPFPDVPPEADLDRILPAVEKYVGICTEKLKEYESNSGSNAIHVMGEMTFIYHFVQSMSESGVLCVASTSKRIIVNEENNQKTTKFEFVRFRPYTTDLF